MAGLVSEFLSAETSRRVTICDEIYDAAYDAAIRYNMMHSRNEVVEGTSMYRKKAVTVALLLVMTMAVFVSMPLSASAASNVAITTQPRSGEFEIGEYLTLSAGAEFVGDVPEGTEICYQWYNADGARCIVRLYRRFGSN